MNTENKTSYRFGFDVGTNSLGWSVFELNEDNKIVKLKSAGSRIFTDGRSVKSRATTLKSERQNARSARRMRDRFIQRQKYLLNYLTEIGLFPADEAQRLMLQKENPIKLRADALTTKLQPHQIGRALFHLNQRRGFKSNRKDSGQDVKDGTVSKSVNKLLIEMGLMTASTVPNPDTNPDARVGKKKFSKEEKAAAKAEKERQYAERRGAEDKLAGQSDASFGTFLYELHKEGKPIRARRDAESKLYDFYPTRGLLEDEFNKICTAQSKHYPKLFSDEVIAKIKKIIFTQRPLKAAVIGICAFVKGERRAYCALPSFQRYRIYQEVNNLKWNDLQGEIHSLRNYPKARDAIVAYLETNKKMTFNKMKNMLKKMGVTEFNYEIETRDGFDGNLTSFLMQDENRIGAQWHDWSLEKQNQFIETLLGYEEIEVKGKKETRSKDDARVLAELKSEYALSDMSAESCLEAEMFLPSGTARLSKIAANLLIPKMRDDYLQLYDAIVAVAEESEKGYFNNPHTTEKKNLDEQLSYYGKVFQDGSHIIPGTGEEEDKNDEHKFYGGVSNPTVHIALNQIRRVVNELILRYGLPGSMSIELGRDLPAGETMIKALNKEQSNNKNRNDRYDKILIEQGQLQNRENRLLLRLWEELGAPLDRRCLYSGVLITLTDLFNGEATEVDHILPFSDSLDDSYANKILVTKKSNQYKRKKTPFEAFGDNPTGYNWEDINKRIANLPESKRWRFQKNAKEIWETDKKDFTERHLNDTRYIGRLAREYLSHICPSEKIDVVTGRLTALLRREWSLNRILSNDVTKKNRDDHRHHAVDAIVIGATTKSMIQWVSKTAREMDNHPGLDMRQIFRTADGKSKIDPWQGFRKDVKMIVDNIIVSHKPTRKKSGQLHKETAYGIVEFLNKEDKDAQQPMRTPVEAKVIWTKPVEEYTTEKQIKEIGSRSLREELLKRFNEEGKEGVSSYVKSKGIRRIRCVDNISVVPIRRRGGEVYKGYKGDSNWAVEIYEMPKPTSNSRSKYKAGEWKESIISRFDANTKAYKDRESYKSHPAAKLVMRLHINDCIEIEENGKKQIMRLQQMSRGKLIFVEHYEANVDKRNRDKQDSFKFMQKAVPVLKKINARQIYISPTGLIRYKKRKGL